MQIPADHRLQVKQLVEIPVIQLQHIGPGTAQQLVLADEHRPLGHGVAAHRLSIHAQGVLGVECGQVIGLHRIQDQAAVLPGQAFGEVVDALHIAVVGVDDHQPRRFGAEGGGLFQQVGLGAIMGVGGGQGQHIHIPEADGDPLGDEHICPRQASPKAAVRSGW